jgi:hypothetical protein
MKSSRLLAEEFFRLKQGRDVYLFSLLIAAVDFRARLRFLRVTCEPSTANKKDQGIIPDL